ncbi:ATP12 family chaperone protein [Pelagibacterium lacus]|uniref:ATPase n=1 Tax=Pelagibacterium lacus TaxID=2282655 RepID=A0A369W707_9HYPH|nr:ATP12 family protein [Pelagibacterium lacus]RDE09779.1 ATPase [Pelagibacterium lacus]
MRDFLEDALQHLDAGAGRQQRDRLVELPKRFYTLVEVEERDGAFVVTLDRRVTKTPTGKTVSTSHRDLAAKMQAEWAAQGEYIAPDSMPHVKLINSAVEGGEEAQPALVDEVLKYAANDLLLYRADSPRELVRRQEKVWDDVLVRLARHFSVSFQPTVGILHKEQSPDMLARLRASIAPLHFVPATAMVSVTGLTGSGLLAIALHAGLVDRDAVWTAAHVDEDYQISLWGEDFEAAEKRRQRRREFDAAANVINFLERFPI